MDRRMRLRVDFPGQRMERTHLVRDLVGRRLVLAGPAEVGA